MPTEIYKQFEIYPGNLFCSINGNFMFPNTIFKSVEEIKARIDLYWQQAEEMEAERNKRVRKIFGVKQSEYDCSDEAREIEQQEFEDKMNEYYEIQNLGE